jgi:hypothetical protein
MWMHEFNETSAFTSFLLMLHVVMRHAAPQSASQYLWRWRFRLNGATSGLSWTALELSQRLACEDPSVSCALIE